MTNLVYCAPLFIIDNLFFTFLQTALTQSNKDKADIALDDAENESNFRNTHYDTKVITQIESIGMDSFTDCLNQQHSTVPTSRRRHVNNANLDRNIEIQYSVSQEAINQANALSQWKRIMLLVIAITVHNIPEGIYLIQLLLSTA